MNHAINNQSTNVTRPKSSQSHGSGFGLGDYYEKGLRRTMEAIVKRHDNLPAAPTDLNKWLLVNKVRLTAQIEAIKVIDKIDMGVEAYNAALSETQDLAEELLYAEICLGEILAKRKNRGSRKRTPDNKSLAGEEPLPEGINKRQSHKAQFLWKNEKMVPVVVKAARETNKVPLRREVFIAVAKASGKTMVPRLVTSNKKASVICLVDELIVLMDVPNLVLIPKSIVLAKLRQIAEKMKNF